MRNAPNLRVQKYREPDPMNGQQHIRVLFFRDDETVMQLHVPRKDHINFHKYCLHLWRPQFEVIPRPPAILVGPVPTPAVSS